MYWNMYEPLKKNSALLEKLIGHKEHGVVTAYRYASGSITSPQLLFLAVQESVRAAIDKIPGSYKGENTLKESVIAWMEEPSHNRIVNILLQKPEWMAEFSQSTADEIINTLKKSTEISGLMDSIFKMAEKEGLTVLSLTADSLCKWIIDVITKNNTKVVLIWDEFSGFFRQNRNSLDEFQKIVALCEETHFYFVIVTHPISSIAGATVGPMVLFQLALLVVQTEQFHRHPHQAEEAVHALLDFPEAHLNRRIADHLGHLVNGDLKILVHVLIHKGSPP